MKDLTHSSRHLQYPYTIKIYRTIQEALSMPYLKAVVYEEWKPSQKRNLELLPIYDDIKPIGVSILY